MRQNKKQAALDYLKSIHVEYDSDPVIAYCAFEAGAEWMQKKIIEKACEWLKNNWREYVYQDRDNIVHFGHWESDFRKAMEE
jgi:hypothetical protein